MKRTLFLAIAAMLVLASAAAAGIQGTKHDLSTNGAASASYKSNNVSEICVFCHTPHSASAATGFSLLWNRTVSTVTTYTMYGSTGHESPTLNATPAAMGGSDFNISTLCLSCHDGTIAVGSLLNNPGSGDGTTPSNSAAKITGFANMGSDLSNDHPINFAWSTAVAADGGIKGSVDPSWYAGDKMQCSSCHDVHDNSDAPFLNASNVNSGLCTSCHDK